MSKSNKDLYALLGVTLTASDAEIRSAYRKQVLLLHPDSSGSTVPVESFQAIRDAYDLLIDPRRRKAYDAERSERGWTANPRKLADQRTERKLEQKRATSGQLKVTARILNATEPPGNRPLREAPPQTNQVLNRDARDFAPALDQASSKPLGFFTRLFRRH